MERRGSSRLSGGPRSTSPAGYGRAQSRAERESAALQEREGEAAWAWAFLVEQDWLARLASALDPPGPAREAQEGTRPRLRPPMRQGLNAAQAAWLDSLPRRHGPGPYILDRTLDSSRGTRLRFRLPLF